jgi:hypothetical protein
MVCLSAHRRPPPWSRPAASNRRPKDKYNRSSRRNDVANFGAYLLDPEVPKPVDAVLHAGCAPTRPGDRTDIVALLSPNNTRARIYCGSTSTGPDQRRLAFPQRRRAHRRRHRHALERRVQQRQQDRRWRRWQRSAVHDGDPVSGVTGIRQPVAGAAQELTMIRFARHPRRRVRPVQSPRRGRWLFGGGSEPRSTPGSRRPRRCASRRGAGRATTGTWTSRGCAGNGSLCVWQPPHAWRDPAPGVLRDGASFRSDALEVAIDDRGALRDPRLERIPGAADGLSALLRSHRGGTPRATP